MYIQWPFRWQACLWSGSAKRGDFKENAGFRQQLKVIPERQVEKFVIEQRV